MRHGPTLCNNKLSRGEANDRMAQTLLKKGNLSAGSGPHTWDSIAKIAAYTPINTHKGQLDHDTAITPVWSPKVRCLRCVLCQVCELGGGAEVTVTQDSWLETTHTNHADIFSEQNRESWFKNTTWSNLPDLSPSVPDRIHKTTRMSHSGPSWPLMVINWIGAEPAAQECSLIRTDCSSTVCLLILRYRVAAIRSVSDESPTCVRDASTHTDIITDCYVTYGIHRTICGVGCK